MNRMFVRGLWGIYDDKGSNIIRRRIKIDRDIEFLQYTFITIKTDNTYNEIINI